MAPDDDLEEDFDPLADAPLAGEHIGPTEGLDRTGAGPLRVRRLRLKVLSGPSAGATYSSAGSRTVVGTHPSTDLVLADRTVSRFHSEITVAGGKVRIRDLESRNGTKVDGVTVSLAILEDGATLTLGRTRLRFDLGKDWVDVPASDRASFGSLVGRSPAMRAVFALLERAAQSDATVLLGGETGTGKDVAAEAIHRESARRAGPFVIVDCGAIPEGLLESELFGHQRGAFTDATQTRVGAFEAAHGGTLFLDEIGELPPGVQSKLLRALDRREIRKVGSDAVHKVNVRVVAATNRNLRAEVNAGRFRPDLFYRLAVIETTLPPLRDRDGDLPLLVDHLLEAMGAAGHPGAAAARTDRFLAELARHAWPGNVRELRNYLERCLAVEDPEPPSAGPPARGERAAVDASVPLRVARERWLRGFEEEYLRELLRRHGDNVSAAARTAGVDRVHLHRLLARAGLRGK